MDVDSSDNLSNNVTRAVHQDDQESGSSSEEGGENGESGESGVESKTSDSEGDGGDRRNQDEDEWSDETESSVGTSDGVAPEEELLLFPAVLPAMSIKTMTQAVGCHLPGYVAAGLGNLAIDKLRRVVIIANQLRKHDQCQGLGVDHFSVAEKSTCVQSFGHKTTHALPQFKHIGVGKGVSVIDDSSVRIDLHSTILYSRNKQKPLRKLTKLSLSDLRLNTTRISSNENYEEDLSPLLATKTYEAEATDASTSSSSEYSNFDLDNECASIQKKISNDKSYQSKERSTRESKNQKNKTFSKEESYYATPAKITSVLETLVEKILVLNEEAEVGNGNVDGGIENGTKMENTNQKNVFGENKILDLQVQNRVVVGIEWIDYVKVFISSFFSSPIESKDSNLRKRMNKADVRIENGDMKFFNTSQEGENGEEIKTNSNLISQKLKINTKDFKLIIEDITSNGAFPVLSVMLNFFGDYMRGKFGNYNSEGLRRILNVLGATLTCSVETDVVYASETK